MVWFSVKARMKPDGSLQLSMLSSHRRVVGRDCLLFAL
jgi:hypothetical protein